MSSVVDTLPGVDPPQGLEPVAKGTAPAVTPRAPINVNLGLAPTTLDEGWRLANMMATSSLVPKAFLNKPADVLVAIELGMELGLAPMQALQSIAVINGRASIWGDGFLGLLMASPHYQDHEEYYLVDGKRQDRLTAADLSKDTTEAVCTFLRRGKATPVTRTFSIAKARKAGLWSKDGPWQQYPDRMLAMRARGFAGRDCFPDVLRGIRTAEEARDERLGETIEGEPEKSLPQPARRLSQALPAAEPVETQPPIASTQQPVAPAEPAKPAETLKADPTVGVIVSVTVKDGAGVVRLSTGYRCATRNPELIGAAQALVNGKPVRLGVEATRDAKYAPKLIEIWQESPA